MYTTHIITQLCLGSLHCQRSYEPQPRERLSYIFILYTFSLSAWYNNIVCYDRIINELLVITLTSIRTNKYVFLYLKGEKRSKKVFWLHSSNFYYVKITNFRVNKKVAFRGGKNRQIRSVSRRRFSRFWKWSSSQANWKPQKISEGGKSGENTSLW